MNQGKYVFSQIMEFIPYYQFNQCVKRYKGDHRVRKFSCREQFQAMAFGQLTYRESLRDVVVCLGSQKRKLYHLGFSSRVTKTTLARVSENRDWRIFRDFAQILIEQARKLYTDDQEFKLNLESTSYVVSV